MGTPRKRYPSDGPTFVMWRQDLGHNPKICSLKPAARWDFIALVSAMRLAGIRDYRWCTPRTIVGGVLGSGRADATERRLGVLRDVGLISTRDEEHMIVIEVCNPAEFLKLTTKEKAELSGRPPLTETEKIKEKEQEETDTETSVPARPLLHRLEASKLLAIQQAKSSGVDERHIERAARAMLKCGMDASPEQLLSEAKRVAEVS